MNRLQEALFNVLNDEFDLAQVPFEKDVWPDLEKVLADHGMRRYDDLESFSPNYTNDELVDAIKEDGSAPMMCGKDCPCGGPYSEDCR